MVALCFHEVLHANLLVSCLVSSALAVCAAQNVPQSIPGGYALPNGWRLTPIGKSIPTEDMVLSASAAPDGLAVVAIHAGYNPHGLVVVDTKTDEAVQRIPLKSAWAGMTWSPDGKRLYVSGGNANSNRNPTRAPIYVFDYANGRLSAEPVKTFEETIETSELFWAGVAHHPKKNILYAANRGTGSSPGNVVAFDATSGKLLGRIPVELTPYDLIPSDDGRFLYVSNLASKSVSVIETSAMKVVASIPVDLNPNQMVLSQDGLLYVACSNDNTVVVIDTKTRAAIERISTTLFPHAPEGSTPNALALDRANGLLYVANADNNDVAVIHVAGRGKSDVLGFVPTGWYPSALAFLPKQQKLYIGNSKGSGSYSDIKGPGSPLATSRDERESIKSLQKGSVEIVNVANVRTDLKQLTKKVYDNTPYNDSLLAQARRQDRARALRRRRPLPISLRGRGRFPRLVSERELRGSESENRRFFRRGPPARPLRQGEPAPNGSERGRLRVRRLHRRRHGDGSGRRGELRRREIRAGEAAQDGAPARQLPRRDRRRHFVRRREARRSRPPLGAIREREFPGSRPDEGDPRPGQSAPLFLRRRQIRERRLLREHSAQGVNFSRADLSLSNFRLANLKRANLSEVRGFNADLSGTMMVGANLQNASLEEADLRFARAIGANFTGASLVGADLANADLSEAIVKGAKLWGATARRAKAPSGRGLYLALSTMFSKAKQKKTKTLDLKEKARAKRIAQLEAEADKRPPHATRKEGS